MALNSMGLGVTFTARDAMSGTLFRLQRAFSGLEVSSRVAVAAIGAGFATMAAGIATAVAGLAGLETGFNLASKTAEFEAGIKRVGLVAQATEPQLAAMREAVIDQAQRTGFDTQGVTKGLEEIAALGFSADESLAMLGPALDLAAAGGISVADAAEAMGSAMKVFSVESNLENMQAVASQLVGISNTTALQAKDLRIALGTVGRGASAANQELGETLIMMGLVKNTGVDATVAASSVSSALLFMAENAKKFKDLGIDVEDANGQIRKMGDVFLDLNEVLKSNPHASENIAVVKDLLQRFGITAYQGVITQLTKGGIKDDKTGIIYKNADALEHLRKEMEKFKSMNLAGMNAEAMIGTFAGLTKRLGVIWETLLIELGRGFIDVLIEPLQWLVDWLQEFERFMRSLPPGVKKFGAAMFLAASAMMVAAGAGMILGGAITIVAAVIALAGAPLLAWMGIFLATAIPLAAIAAVLTGAFILFGGAVALVFTKNLGGATDKLLAFYNKWKLILSATLEFLQSGSLTGALADEFGAADAETQDTVKRFYLFFEKLKAGFLAMTDTIVMLLDGKAGHAFERITQQFFKLTDALGLTDGAYTGVIEAMNKGDVEAQGKLIGDTLVKAFDWITEAIIWSIKAMTLFVDTLSFIWKFKDLFQAVARGDVVGIGKAMWALEYGEEGAKKPAITPDNQVRLNELEFQAESMRLRHGEGVSLPAATAAEAGGQAQQLRMQTLWNAAKDTHDPTKKLYTIENRLYLDGKVIWENVKQHASADSADSFAGDGSIPWSEA